MSVAFSMGVGEGLLLNLWHLTPSPLFPLLIPTLLSFLLLPPPPCLVIITRFEYAPEDEGRFEELLRRLRETPEWEYVSREVDVRLERKE